MYQQQISNSLNKTKILFWATCLFFISANAMASPLNLLVLTKDKQAAENVGVSLTPLFEVSPEQLIAQPQEMNQIKTQFVPHILMAQKGAKISFPNSDSVQHHVYSFSEAKTFELKLYKDQKPEPLPFEQTGQVTLGCNIHDWMLAYIYVVDTPFFAKTNESGLVKLDIPKGKYRVNLHSPLLQGMDAEFSLELDASSAVPKSFTISLSEALLPNLNEFDDDDEFDAY